MNRRRGHQGTGIGVQRFPVEPVAGRQFDDLAEVHHGHPVGDVADHAEVVGNEQVGEPEPLLQILEKVDDLGLDRHVERGDRFVADDELGLEGEGAGDADALALAAGELVRVSVRKARAQSHRVQ